MGFNVKIQRLQKYLDLVGITYKKSDFVQTHTVIQLLSAVVIYVNQITLILCNTILSIKKNLPNTKLFISFSLCPHPMTTKYVISRAWCQVNWIVNCIYTAVTEVVSLKKQSILCIVKIILKYLNFK